MPTRDKNRLTELEQQDAALSRNEESIIVVRKSLFFKCRFIYRPLQIVLGLFLLSFALLIFISLLLSNINKLMNFVSFQQIFAQGNQTLPNPIDLLLQWTGKVKQNENFFVEIRQHSYRFSVLSDQLHRSISTFDLHHSFIALRFTTNRHLVFLGSRKLKTIETFSFDFPIRCFDFHVDEQNHKRF